MKLLRSTLQGLPRTLPMLQHQAAGQVVPRLRGSALQYMRKRLLARSGGRCECELCQEGYPLAITWETFEADHVTPLHLGGTNALANFRALHPLCHQRITREQKKARTHERSAWTDRMP